MTLRSAASAQPNLPLSFSDSLSPVELVDWLTQELVAKGLTLEPSQRQALIGEAVLIDPLWEYSVRTWCDELRVSLEEHINGKAFRELTDDELKELGFKMGPRKNIRGIISSIEVSYGS